MAKLNLNKIKAKAEEIKERDKARKEGGKGDSAFLNKIPTGVIEVRLLPPWSDAGELAKEISTHFKLPPGNSTVVDLAATHPRLGLDNPIGEVLEDFKDDVDVSRLWSKATPKINVYIPDSDINQDNEELSQEALGKVKILSPSTGVYNQIVSMISSPRIGDITDPDEGFNLTIEKTTGASWQDTRYKVQLCPRPCAIHEDPDEQERILEKTWDLDKMFPAPDDAKIAEIHLVAAALRKHLEKQVRQLGGTPKRRTRVAKEDEPEEEDELEEEELEEEELEEVEEEEEEEEEAPKPEAKKKAKKKRVTPPLALGEDEETPPQSKKKLPTTSSTKKKSATSKPDCYGDSDTYKVTDEQYEVCNACIWEVPCMQQQKKAGTFSYEE